MLKKQKIIIVGGVAGGATAAARARRLDENAEIILLERGKYVSFANCGLPYFVGEKIVERDRLLVQTPEGIKKRFNIDVRISTEVLKIYPKIKQILATDLKTGHKYKESYDKLILAPGASPFKPQMAGIDHFRVFTLRTIPDAEKIKKYVGDKKPKRVAILGGGPIGLEMAENLYGIGLEVSIFELSDHVVATLDLDMASIVHNYLRSKGIKLYLQTEVVKIEHEESTSTVISKDNVCVKADVIILGIGVRPETSLAFEAGLKLGGTGGISVNEYLQTSDPNIYAIGDAIEVKDFVSGEYAVIALAGPANKQGRIAAGNILGKKEKFLGSEGTGILKVFDMTIASTGLNERLLKKFNIPYKLTILHTISHAGYYPGAFPITLKLLFSPKGEILGAEGAGYDGVDKRIDVIATAMRAGMTVRDLQKIDLCYAPPFSSAKDPVNMLGYMAANILDGLVKTYTHEEIEKRNKEKTTLLDVRTRLEYKGGHIDGSINIPIDELRSKLSKLPKNKEIYVYCAVGLRAYLASRVLFQHGFKVKSLVGGYKTYEQIYSESESAFQQVKTESVLEMEERGIPNSIPMEVSDVTIDEEIDKDEGIDKEMPTIHTKVSLKVNACGLMCPGPLMRVNEGVKKLKTGEVLEARATDPAFLSDVPVWCQRTENKLLSLNSKSNIITALIQKGDSDHAIHIDHKDESGKNHSKTILVFSDDIDKVIASFIIANGAAAMGRKVTMFFTFWGLNVIRRPEAVPVKKDIISKAFALMMPRGSRHLHLSQMNMGGIGTKLIRYLMIKKHIGTLEEMISEATKAGVKMIACSTSMDIMGIKKEEFIDGVEVGGVSTFLGDTEESDASLIM
ncbi:MAG: FAD-dependent pyridine nucleotide-disulfide oxidoreductase [candidate division CPR2 bacterium GW2011_GWC1_41_48]|uniref:FAD-dependent pyridine nucleotide-disulfide oxidoreductase n=1 Tax=candidate division CPR2 bacterium GW2011_GWC1_41_48 TaxID=1618344 RepID=A0A0G0W971_UNCC2|nr:MAG: FAD-dependent pyridine nucleotide-disulfide oxidoreductase [candidate division CPR2 bacterium GW2011_GWC2_39_35]KKR29024.1 MAG: FAD-dependent pyridine nucleotide-disulfide oxidoreductase [candidate division CPR2 bacterium GW2011_GWD2_39_7]KKS09520.1 MAG: FAD-dependent pyridine nucleotide-disulfide oxidoreductase [candidate division CPR2 bacterium GW2011_GWC1_41_48]OGB70422.1 MAG: pyridine nucleotide-disulfide oxidoreductase [candidate division CPR2 bacterium GWD2_39_7]